MEEQFPGTRFIRLPRNFGSTKALNLGIRAAEAEYVFFLSPEVKITYDAVLELADTLERELDVGAVCPLLKDGSGVPVAQVAPLPNGGDPDPEFVAALPGAHAESVTLEAVLFRSFFLRALRQIDERYGDYGSAPEICQQINRANKKILIHPTVSAATARTAVADTMEQEADRELGTARFLGKHRGFLAGFGYLAKRILAALFQFRFGKLVALVSQKKIDGG